MQLLLTALLLAAIEQYNQTPSLMLLLVLLNLLKAVHGLRATQQQRKQAAQESKAVQQVNKRGALGLWSAAGGAKKAMASSWTSTAL